MTDTIPDIKFITDEQLVEGVKQEYALFAKTLGVYVEARIRIHECDYHGREGREDCIKILADSGSYIESFMESIAPKL